jgi:hypothetical protein
LKNQKVFEKSNADFVITTKHLFAISKTSSALKIIYPTSVKFNIAVTFEINRSKCLCFFKMENVQSS